MIYGTILCIGDSLIAGSRDEHGLSMPRMLGRLLSKRHEQSWIGIDEGVNGETTSDLLRRLYQIVCVYPEAAYIVICIGTNDAKVPGLSLQVFEESYREILRTTKMVKKLTLVCTIPKRKGPGAPDQIDNDLIERYNKVILKLAHEGGPKGHPLVWYVSIDEVPDGLRSDGIHFNHAGNIWFAEKVAEIIERTWA